MITVSYVGHTIDLLNESKIIPPIHVRSHNRRRALPGILQSKIYRIAWANTHKHTCLLLRPTVVLVLDKPGRVEQATIAPRHRRRLTLFSTLGYRLTNPLHAQTPDAYVTASWVQPNIVPIPASMRYSNLLDLRWSQITTALDPATTASVASKSNHLSVNAFGLPCFECNNDLTGCLDDVGDLHQSHRDIDESR